MFDDSMDMDAPMSAPQQSNSRNSVNQDSLDIPLANPPPPPPAPSSRNFRDVHVKVHIRYPGRDSWVYLGRGIVTQEVGDYSSFNLTVRSASVGDRWVIFNEGTELQAEKRGTFVIVSCVDKNRVISYSLNAMNNSDTIRLLAGIELTCSRSKMVLRDSPDHVRARRRTERIIKEDRRRRHKRRKEQDAMVDAFAKQTLSTDTTGMDATASIPPDL